MPFSPAATPRPRLPTYPNLTPSDAQATLRQRASALQSLQADVDLQLSQRPAQSVRLNAVLIAQPPDHLRLRAWKLGQPVFDLTLTPDAAYLQSGQKSPDRQPPPQLAELARRLLPVLTGSLPPEAALVSESSKALVYSWPETTGPTDNLVATATLDRETLIPSRYTLSMPADAGATAAASFTAPQFDLQLSHFQLDPSGVVYPTRLSATAIDSNGNRNTIRLSLKDVAINQPLPASAFTPPRSAQRLTP